ncbi:20 kDa chaperonin [Musa troglodytarum]|uniref:20 kDa chaperonin, chloroplastic n=1 Tax=Musa troglodytarum TaxID=320322 RepID=A0A9E7F7Q4_9LILI|nr:20 kDa chaperonin [Musa troglodytarum]URD88848.1 20 kDa chaperonin [Musa troglodytarum]URD88849.1 20 kDa chaperonin [Musa troglodytarum]URD88850.1 20 kDa chaperonin [Musa troglodytarum]
MASLQLSGTGNPAVARRSLPSIDGLRLSPFPFRLPSSIRACRVALERRGFRGHVVKATTVVAPKYTSVKPLGDRVLVKINTSEEVTVGGILLPTTAQSKPQAGEVVAVGDGRTIGNDKVQIGIQMGSQVVYSKYAGTELEFNGSNHVILKEDDIVGILEADDVKDLKPLNDRVLIKVAEAEEKTAGGLLLTEASKEKPSIGTVIAVGPGPLDVGNRKPLTSITPGSTVLYSKYAGNEFKSADGSLYIALRASDVMAVLS